jgi:hypothetical protein
MSNNVYTTVASSMVVSTGILNNKLSQLRVGTSRRVLKTMPPAGPSSGGGELSRQSLTLDNGAEATVCGWVDFVSKQSEVRDFETAQRAYEARYRVPFDVRESEHRNWADQLIKALKELGVRAAITGEASNYAPTDPAVGGRAEEPAAAAGPSLLPVIIAAALAGLGLVVGLYLVMR